MFENQTSNIKYLSVLHVDSNWPRTIWRLVWERIWVPQSISVVKEIISKTAVHEFTLWWDVFGHVLGDVLYVFGHVLENVLYVFRHVLGDVLYVFGHVLRDVLYVFGHVLENVLYVFGHVLGDVLYVFGHVLENVLYVFGHVYCIGLKCYKWFLSIYFKIFLSKTSLNYSSYCLTNSAECLKECGTLSSQDVIVAGREESWDKMSFWSEPFLKITRRHWQDNTITSNLSLDSPRSGMLSEIYNIILHAWTFVYCIQPQKKM